MTHDELITQLQYDRPERYLEYASALRAVVELHRPSGVFCLGCGFDSEYNEPSQLLPCETIQAITEQLK